MCTTMFREADWENGQALKESLSGLQSQEIKKRLLRSSHFHGQWNQ